MSRAPPPVVLDMTTLDAELQALRSTHDKLSSTRGRRVVLDCIIRSIRNKLHMRSVRNPFYSVMFTHILQPMLAHGSFLIYSPDLTAETVWKWCRSGTPATRSSNLANPSAPQMSAERCRQCVGALPLTETRKEEILRAEASAFAPQHSQAGCAPWRLEMTTARVTYVLGVVVLLVLLLWQAQLVKCMLQNVLLGWAMWNHTLQSRLVLLLSIAILMCVRQLVSNVLPFTSPIFAFLIARSMPDDIAWAGTFYMLFGSMFAGALLPLADGFVWLYRSRRAAPNTELALDDHFVVTNCMSSLTDWLPFSFWVRPYVIRPVFEAVYTNTRSDDVSASTAALLAGHFMFWAGPATSMHQRKFVPDWITSVCIQPLGLMEDVAVVLASWAAIDALNKEKAEVGMYMFMLSMNAANYCGRAERSNQKMKEHFIAGGCVALCLIMVWWGIAVAPPLTMTTMTTTASAIFVDGMQCVTVHTDLTAFAMMGMKGTTVAVVSRLLSRFLTTYVCADEAAHDPKLLPA